MKRILRDTRTLGLGAVLALAIAAGPAIAGPSPQCSQQQEKVRTESAQKAHMAAPNQADVAGMACSSCKTKIYEEEALPNLADKTVPRVVKVGRRHYCGACKGTITRLEGRVTDEMTRNHPACANAGANCCSV